MTGALIISDKGKTAVNGFHPLDDSTGHSAFSRIVMVLSLLKISPIVIITSQRGYVEQHLARKGVVCLGPLEYSPLDLLIYYRQARSIFEIRCDRILVLPVSHALVHESTIQRILTASVLPVRAGYNNKGGYPLLLSTENFKHFVSGGTFDYHPENMTDFFSDCITVISVPDAFVSYDISTEEDWRLRLGEQKISVWHPVSKFTLAKENVFFGPGSYQLLRALTETGSVRSACQLTGISYSKGFKIIGDLEKETGLSIVKRRKGGEHGGAATVTPEGEKLLSAYERYQEACNTAVEKLFSEYFEDFGGY